MLTDVTEGDCRHLQTVIARGQSAGVSVSVAL